MRILILHSRYSSGSASGENRVVEDERTLLTKGGHYIDDWTPQYADLNPMRAGLGAVWSRRAREEITQRVLEQRIEVIHAHNLFPVHSPAVLRTGLPTVITLHNYRLACLPATFLRGGRICESCLGHVPWRGIAHGCYRDSRLASSVLATSLTLHRAIRTFHRVNRYIVLSEFQRQKLSLAGLDPERMIVRRNFTWPLERRSGSGEYFLTLGRLSVEKGLDTVIGSWRSALPLLVVGDGPERARLEALARPGVEFRGAIEPNEAALMMRRARALLFPSRWYEGSPRALIEALAAGVPVIASDTGGLVEHVKDGVSGLLVRVDDEEAWTGAIERLGDDAESERLGHGAYESWRESFNPQTALRSLEQVYEEAVESSAASGRTFFPTSARLSP